MPPNTHGEEAGGGEPAHAWASRYPGTRFHGKSPRRAKAHVTDGLRWAPDTVPMK